LEIDNIKLNLKLKKSSSLGCALLLLHAIYELRSIHIYIYISISYV